jgi:NADH:ubiquinone oxidoreductase subunit 5 (subunit L)/multisubunit Na+/H+ antiporter MnhA subunit
MTALPTSPALLMTGVLALIAGGLIVMTWGRRLPRQGSWIIGLGLLVLLVVVGIDWSILSEEGFAPQPWLRGWIWPREEVGAITVGVLRDALGLSMASLTALVAGSADP